MEGVKKLATLAREHVSEGGTLSTAEGFSYSKYLLRPLKHLSCNTQLLVSCCPASYEQAVMAQYLHGM